MENRQPTRLNAMQHYRLHLLDRELSPKQEAEIRQLLPNYFVKLVDDEMDISIAERGLTSEQLEKQASIYR